MNANGDNSGNAPVPKPVPPLPGAEGEPSESLADQAWEVLWAGFERAEPDATMEVFRRVASFTRESQGLYPGYPGRVAWQLLTVVGMYAAIPDGYPTVRPLTRRSPPDVKRLLGEIRESLEWLVWVQWTTPASHTFTDALQYVSHLLAAGPNAWKACRLTKGGRPRTGSKRQWAIVEAVHERVTKQGATREQAYKDIGRRFKAKAGYVKRLYVTAQRQSRQIERIRRAQWEAVYGRPYPHDGA